MKIPGRSLVKTSFCALALGGALCLASCTTTLNESGGGGMAIGTRVARLPSVSERFEVNGTLYYRSGPDYFIRRDDQFVVVSSPRSTWREKSAMYRRYRRF